MSESLRIATRTILADKSLWPTLFLLPLFLWGSERSMRNVLACGGSAIVALVLLGVLAVLTKPPPSRIYFQLLTFPLAVVLLAARDRIVWPRRRWPSLSARCFVTPGCWGRPGARRLLHPTMAHVLVILAAIGVGMAFTRQFRCSLRIQAVRQSVLEFTTALDTSSDRLYISWGGDFPYEAISPFDNLKSFSKLRVFVFGWPQHTPFATAMKEKFGIESMARALFERQDVIMWGGQPYHTWYRQFVLEHFGAHVKFVPCHAGHHKFDIAGRFEPVMDGVATTRDRSPSSAQR